MTQQSGRFEGLYAQEGSEEGDVRVSIWYMTGGVYGGSICGSDFDTCNYEWVLEFQNHSQDMMARTVEEKSFPLSLFSLSLSLCAFSSTNYILEPRRPDELHTVYR